MSVILKPAPIVVQYNTSSGGGTPWTPPVDPWTPSTQHLTGLGAFKSGGAGSPDCYTGFSNKGAWVRSTVPPCNGTTSTNYAVGLEDEGDPVDWLANSHLTGMKITYHWAASSGGDPVTGTMSLYHSDSGIISTIFTFSTTSGSGESSIGGEGNTLGLGAVSFTDLRDKVGLWLSTVSESVFPCGMSGNYTLFELWLEDQKLVPVPNPNTVKCASAIYVIERPWKRKTQRRQTRTGTGKPAGAGTGSYFSYYGWNFRIPRGATIIDVELLLKGQIRWGDDDDDDPVSFAVTFSSPGWLVYLTYCVLSDSNFGFRIWVKNETEGELEICVAPYGTGGKFEDGQLAPWVCLGQGTLWNATGDETGKTATVSFGNVEVIVTYEE